MLRWVCAATWLFALLLLASCGGGSGGTDVSSSSSALTFSAVAGDPAVPQTISVTLESADGTVYAGAVSDNTTVALARFSVTGATSGRITVTPVLTLPPGTYTTTVRLVVCSDSACNHVLRTFSYGVTVNILPGLS